MPKKQTIKQARHDKQQGKAPSTQAGEFVRETIEDIRHGKHGARSTKQAIAIGLSKARRAGVKLAPPAKGKTSAATRRHAERDYERGQSQPHLKVSAKRSRAVTQALRREGSQAVSTAALSEQARQQSHKRTSAERSAIGRQAARTRLAHQTLAERRAIARKAARSCASRHAS
jgi:hypothetical protein